MAERQVTSVHCSNLADWTRIYCPEYVTDVREEGEDANGWVTVSFTEAE